MERGVVRDCGYGGFSLGDGSDAEDTVVRLRCLGEELLDYFKALGLSVACVTLVRRDRPSQTRRLWLRLFSAGSSFRVSLELSLPLAIVEKGELTSSLRLHLSDAGCTSYTLWMYQRCNVSCCPRSMWMPYKVCTLAS